MKNQLQRYHIFCKNEHLKLLQKFNILYYGFGCKKQLLLKMFPDAIQFDMNFYRIADIIFELNSKFETNHSCVSDFKNDNILILINFDFTCSNLFMSTSFRLIFTIDKIRLAIKHQDFTNLNCVLRDLTTYESYKIEITDQKIQKLESYLSVIRNGSKNSKLAYKSLLEFESKTVHVNDLFNKIKKILLITRKNTVFNFLSEFIDHKMIKIRDLQTIELCTELQHTKQMIEECKK